VQAFRSTYIEKKIKKSSEAKSVDLLNDMQANTSFRISPFVQATFVLASAFVNPPSYADV